MAGVAVLSPHSSRRALTTGPIITRISANDSELGSAETRPGNAGKFVM